MQAQPVEETLARAYPKYLQLARGFERQMRAGVLRVGDRLPSVRQLQATHRISVATAIGCYAWLERQGYVRARPKSGFYVSRPPRDIASIAFEITSIVLLVAAVGGVVLGVQSRRAEEERVEPS